jgi:hypothetical protein
MDPVTTTTTVTALAVNAFVATLNSFATTVGTSAADKWYGEGVSNAKSYLQGMQAAFDVAQIKLGATGLTLADIKGIDANFNNSITAPTMPIQDVRSFSDSFGGIGGFGDLNINVTGGISTSAEIGEAVVNAIRAYNRAAGPANIAVA